MHVERFQVLLIHTSMEFQHQIQELRPTTTALPIVSCNVCRSNVPASTASNKMNATIVAKISVNADSKLSIDFVSSEILTFLTRPNTIAELLPPTIEPSKYTI